MIAPLQEALAQVRLLQERIIEKQRFKGYSGRARAISGTIALLAAAMMASPWWPATPAAHLVGWAGVFSAALLLNFGAILYWFLFDMEARRDVRRLRPLLDLFPPLFVAALFTLVFVVHDKHLWLFPMWMCLFGLANLASRHVLPQSIALIGWYYVAAGTLLILINYTAFLNPWPMGIIFFIGEWCGGVVLHFDSGASLSAFFRPGGKLNVETE